MKRLITSFGRCISVCLPILIVLVPLTVQAHVSLSLPNGGEELQVGSNYNIIWVQQIYHTTDNYDLSYSTNGAGGPWIDIALNIPLINTNGGTVYNYSWTIPDDLSNQVRVRVIQDNPGFNYTGTSADDLAIIDTTTVPPPSCCDLPGDANDDGSVDVADLTFIVAFMFGGGPSPTCLDEGDLQADCTIDIADLTYRVAWMFSGGPAPVCGCVVM